MSGRCEDCGIVCGSRLCRWCLRAWLLDLLAATVTAVACSCVPLDSEASRVHSSEHPGASSGRRLQLNASDSALEVGAAVFSGVERVSCATFATPRDYQLERPAARCRPGAPVRAGRRSHVR